MVPQSFWTLLNPVPADQRSLIDGKTVYVTNCIGCHGIQGKADGPADQFLNPFAYNFTSADNMRSGLSTSPGSLYQHILYGIKGTAMPPFGQDLTVQNIWDTVNFLYTIPNGGLKTAEPSVTQFIQWTAPQELLDLSKVPQAAPANGNTTLATPPPRAYREQEPFVLGA